MKNVKKLNDCMKLQSGDKVVSFEFDDNFIKIRFAGDKEIVYTLEDVGDEVLSTMKKKILDHETFVDYLLTLEN